MTSYGAGAHPKIAPGGTIPFGIQFPSSNWTGGWKIVGIDCGNAYATGIAKEGVIANGMWVENCVFDSNRGMRVGVNGSDFSVPGYSLYASSGAHIAGVNYTMFRNCTCTNNNIPFGVRAASYCVVDGVSASASDINSGYMDYDTFSLMNGGRVTTTGGVGYSAGTAGMLISNSNYVQFYGVEIDHTTNPVNNVDEIAIDLEANDNNTSIFNCNLHDNGDCAVFMNGDSTQSGTMIAYNTLNNNGLKSPTGTAAIIKAYPTNDPVIIIGNTLTKAAPTQHLFSLLTWGGLTDTVPPLWTYG